MQQPLAFVVYEKLMPGSQLVNRLQDLNYRVLPVTDASQVPTLAKAQKPMLILADLDFSGVDMGGVVSKLRQNPSTTHIPLITFADDDKRGLMSAARSAGAEVVVTDAAVLTHLSQLLEQALQVE